MKAQEKSYFESFREVAKAVNSTLDLKEVLNLLVSNVTQAMDLKSCIIRLLHPKKRTLEVVASHRLSKKFLNKGPVDADKSISDVLEGKTVSIHNAPEDPRVQYPREIAEEGIASILSVPLSLKGRVIGVMRLFTSEPREFSEEQINSAEAMAEMGAIAIENARMHERIKHDYEAVMEDVYSFVGYRRSL
ncbi:MAG: GAF domain-containing protein [Deltaproteobacteria bacterium]|nr:MAG: GAF domain-containing protein [Deltaproteobacteria bacterium]